VAHFFGPRCILNHLAYLFTYLPDIRDISALQVPHVLRNRTIQVDIYFLTYFFFYLFLFYTCFDNTRLSVNNSYRRHVGGITCCISVTA